MDTSSGIAGLTASSATDTGTSTVHEMMYLIYLYLSNHTPCGQLSELLMSELEKASLLGTTFTWDDRSRPATIRDMKEKFSNIKTDQLLLHLNRYIARVRDSDPFSSPCLAVPLKDDSPSMTYEEMVICANKLVTLSRKKTLLTKIPSSEGDTELSQRNRDLSEIGKEVNLCINSLAKCNFNTSFTPGSSFLCGLHLLGARSFGFGGLHTTSSSTFLRGSRGSCVNQRLQLTCKYNFFWRASGHINNPAYNVIFDRSGRYVITGADDALVKIWDVERGLLLRTLRGHKGCIAQLAVSPDNSMLASCCTMGVIRVWRISDGYCLTLLKTPGGGCVNWIMFDYASTALISVGDDGSCVVWDLFKLIVIDSTGDSDSSLLELVHRAVTSKRLDSLHKTFDMSGGMASVNGEVTMEVLSEIPTKNGIDRSSTMKSEKADAKFSAPDKTSRYDYAVSNPNYQIAANAVIPENALPWTRSAGSQDESHLVLKHFKDASYSDCRRIVALDICPYDRVVVTGCDDGLAQIWRYGEKLRGKDNNLETKTRNNKSFFDNIADVVEETRTQSHRRSDESYVRSSLYVLCRLEGHLSAVMDVKFSRAGDRVVTGSMKDGTVRIWSFSKDFSQTEHIIIPLNDSEESTAMGGSYSGPFRGRQNRNSRMGAKSQVYNLSWSCDDSYVLILQSVSLKNAGGGRAEDSSDIPTRLKQFDSMNGDLLNVINISDCRVDMVISHPFNPLIVVTGGSEGLVVVWNLQEAESICEHVINIETPLTLEQINSAHDRTVPANMMVVDIVDMCFSENGSKIAVTDSFGRVSLFGVGGVTERYQGKYSEQYFSTDYHGVAFVSEMDPRGYDEGTMVPLNDCAPGLLCRADGSPYEEQPIGTLEYVGESLHATISRIIEVIDGAKTYEKVLERSFIAYKRVNKQKQFGAVAAQPVMTRSTWGTNDNTRTIQSMSSTRGAAQVAHSRIRGLHEYHTRGDDFPRAFTYDGVRMGVGVYAVDSSDESDDEMFIPSQQTRTERAVRRASERRVRREHYDSDGSTEEMSVSSSEESDNHDNELSPVRTARSPGKRVRSKRSQASTARSKKDSKKKVKIDSSTLRPWGTLNGHRTVPVGEFIDRSWLQQDEPNDLQYCPQYRDHVVYFPQGHREHLHDFPENSAPPWISFGSKWPVIECRITQLSYEFPNQSEHRRCPSIVARIRLQVLGIPLKWGPGGSSSGITAAMYKEFGQLRATRHSTASELEFDVNLRSATAPDFIVPIHLYMRAATVKWRPGVRFQTYFKEDTDFNGTRNIITSPQVNNISRNSSAPIVGSLSSDMAVYTGKVYRVGDSEPDEWPKSPWESLTVIWTVQNNERIIWDESQDDALAQTDRVSPWDAFVLPANSLVGTGMAQLVTSNTTSSDSSSIVFPGQSRIPHSLREAMLAKLDELMNGDRAKEFAPLAYPVDSDAYPDYYAFVPVPIDMEMIRTRLENNFYRQVAALEFDISLLYSNCILYNNETAEVVGCSRELMHILLSVMTGSIYNSTGLSTKKEEFQHDLINEHDEDFNHHENADNKGESSGLVLKLRVRSNSNVSKDIGLADDVIGMNGESESIVDEVEPDESSSDDEDYDEPIRKKTKRRAESDENIHIENVKDLSRLDSDYKSSSDSDASYSQKAHCTRNAHVKPIKKRARIENKAQKRPTRSSSRKRCSVSSDEFSDEEDKQNAILEDEAAQPRNSRRKRVVSVAATSKRNRRQGQTMANQELSESKKFKTGDDIYKSVLWPSFNVVVAEDEWELFANPVTDDIAPGYSKEITRPTDLSTIRKKLDMRKYRTLEQYKEEMLRMFSNCEKYNKEGSEFADESCRLREIFMKNIADLLSSTELI